jgi:hypothetical protein
LGQNDDAKGQPSEGIQLFWSSPHYSSAETTPSHTKGKRWVVQKEDEDELEKFNIVALSPLCFFFQERNF